MAKFPADSGVNIIIDGSTSSGFKQTTQDIERAANMIVKLQRAVAGALNARTTPNKSVLDGLVLKEGDAARLERSARAVSSFGKAASDMAEGVRAAGSVDLQAIRRSVRAYNEYLAGLQRTPGVSKSAAQSHLLMAQAALTEARAYDKLASAKARETAATNSEVIAMARASAIETKALSDARLRDARARTLDRNMDLEAERIRIRAGNLAVREAAAVQKQAAAEKRAAEEAFHNSLERSRYAAYELYGAYHRTLLAFMAVSGAAAVANARQERSFADVRRVAVATTEELAHLRAEFYNLSVARSMFFSDIAQIAKEGAQANIPTKDLLDFTEAVSAFVLATGEPVEGTTASFGRLSQMMGGLDPGKTGKGFLQLASQVAELGARSISTETQILKMSESLAPSARDAGLAQHEIMALSSTLASLAIPKEWARGSFQRIVAGISKAVAEGGDKLEAFSNRLGMTEAEFRRLWEVNPNRLLMLLASALGSIEDKSARVLAAGELGIKSTRDVQMMARLAQNTGLWVEQLRVAQGAQQDVTFLTESLTVISDTLAARAKAFAVAWENAGAALGTSFSAPLKLVLAAGTALANAIRDMPAPLRAFIGATAAVAATRIAFQGAAVGAVAFAGTLHRVRGQLYALTGESRVTFRAAAAALRSASVGAQGVKASYDALSGSASRLATAQGVVAKQSTSAAAALGASATAAGANTAAAAAGAAQATTKATGLIRGGLGSMIGILGGPLPALFTALGIAGVTALSLITEKADEPKRRIEDISHAMTEAMGGDGALLAAVIKDSNEAARSGAEGVEEMLIKVGELGRETSFSADSMFYWIDSAGRVVTATRAVGEEMGYTAIQIGKATEQLVRQAVMSEDKGVGGLSVEAKTQLADAGFSLQEATRKLFEGRDAYQAYLNSVEQALLGRINAEVATATRAVDQGIQLMVPMYQSGMQLSASMRAAEQAAASSTRSQYQSALDFLNAESDKQVALRNTVEGILVDARLQGAEAFEDIGDSADEAESSVSSLRDSIKGVFDELFSFEDASLRTQEALQGVYEGLQKLAEGADPNAGLRLGQSVREYLGALAEETQIAIEAMGVSGAEAQAMMYLTLQEAINFLQQQGIDISPYEQAIEQIALLAGQPIQMGGVDNSLLAGSLNAAVHDTAHKTNAIRQMLSAVQLMQARTQSQAKAGLFTPNRVTALPALNTGGFAPRTSPSGGGGGGGGRRGGGGAGRAREETKTAEEIFDDFIKRLRTALSDAVERWWAATTAQDNYHKSLNSLRKGIDSTISKMADLRKENESLRASLLEDESALKDAQIFNAVARKYGDAARVAATEADIAKAQSSINEKRGKIASNDREVTELQKGMHALTGYSDAAIANREALKGLQLQMVAMIEDYARSGASTEQVAAYTAKLKEEFIQQATQMGFNRGEVTKLAGAFDAMRTKIGQVPRQVNVKVNVSDGGGIGRMSSALSKLGSQARSLSNTRFNWDAWLPKYDYLDRIAAGMRNSLGRGMYNALNDFEREFNRRQPRWGIKISARNTGGPITGFAGGGRVPGVPPLDPRIDNVLAATSNQLYALRSGEYVISEPAVKHYGLGVMNALNNMSLGAAPTVVVHNASQPDTIRLDPQQLSQLVRAVQQTVTLDGAAIGHSVNNTFANISARGLY